MLPGSLSQEYFLLSTPEYSSTLESNKVLLSTMYAVSNWVCEHTVKSINELFDPCHIIIKINRLKDIMEMKIKRT